MTLSHDETSARLLELVYGEAAPAERVALEAHVATCASCQAELATLGDTRARLRVALDDAPVPARAHARILEAAARAVAPVAASAQAARIVVPAPGPSFWERMRGKWTLPTFATVGAIAIVLFASKVFLEPQRLAERGQQALAPAAPAAPVGERADDQLAKGAAANEPAPPPASAALAPEGARASGPGSMIGGTAGARIAHAVSHGHGHVDGVFGDGLGFSSLARRHDQGAATGAANGLAGASSGGGFASPPPAAAAAPEEAPVAASVSRAAAAPALRRKQVSDSPLDDLDSAPAPRGAAVRDEASADKVAERPAPRAFAAKKKAEEALAEEREAAPGSAKEEAKKPAAPAKTAPASAQAYASPPAQSLGKDANQDAKADAPPTREALTRRAEQLFAARRWSEAIAAYRELLRRFPDADLKTRWRARITQAEAEADASGADAKASKKAAKGAPAEVLPAAE